MRSSQRFFVLACTLCSFFIACSVRAADYPAPVEGDWVVRDFRHRDEERIATRYRETVGRLRDAV